MQPQYRLPFILITTLFFLWGFAHKLNPILIPHLKKACQLTDLQSSLIDSSFFIGYFVTAILAGMLMKRLGNKRGILIGLVLFAWGSFLFYPAADTRYFGLFLLVLFIIASGLTFLETAANPYVTVLGEPATATQRLNLSQFFSGLAASLAPLAGGLFMLSGNSVSESPKAALTSAQLNSFLAQEAVSVQVPYLVIGGLVLLVAILVAFTHLPDITEPESINQPTKNQPTKSRSIWQQKNLVLSIITQFFYVSGQVCVSSFFIRFVSQTAGIDEKECAFYLSVVLPGFMMGRFVGTVLMRYIAPHRLLANYAVITYFLLVFTVWIGGMLSVYALGGVQFFMSIIFSTIFSLSIYGLREHTKLGSSLVIMAVAGGTVFPVLMGRISDLSSMQIAYIIAAFCFLVVGYFALKISAKEIALMGANVQPVPH